MTESVFIVLFFSTLRLSLPLLLATTGGYFSEKSGVAQLGLEGFLLIGAFSSASIGAALSNNQPINVFTLSISYLVAGLSAALLAQLFNGLVLVFKSNAIVIGTALNLFIMGLIPIISKAIFNSTGSTPSLNYEEGLYFFPYAIVILALGFAYWLSEKTLWGLQMKFAGEKALALKAAGVSVTKQRWQSVTCGAFITGIGGAILSTYLASSYSPMMSAGRGYIALAALIFSGWRLPHALFACLFFGFCEALQIQVQAQPDIASHIPLEFIQMTPYLATILILLFFKSNKNAPSELT